METLEHRHREDIADALIGIDTLWGGDVLNPSGTGRFIADCWFSDEELPRAYTHATAAALRASRGVGAPAPDPAAVDAYLAAIDVKGAIARVLAGARAQGGMRGAYLEGLGLCCEVMWDLAMELLDRGPHVSYDRCVRTITGRPPEPSRPEDKRRRVAELIAGAGHPSNGDDALLVAVDAWRAERRVPRKSIATLGEDFIAQYDTLSARHLVPYLPRELAQVPRANVRFLAIENAWFSGSMNYLGHACTHAGRPARVRDHVRAELGARDFGAGVPATREPRSRPGARDDVCVPAGLVRARARRIRGVCTHDEHARLGALRVRRDFLISEERAEKLSGAWGRHPLLGRMYLPAYRAGTELVARLRRERPPEEILPALYGVGGLVDAFTIQR